MTLKLNGSTDGSVSIDAPVDTSPTGSDITLTLPTTVGSANQFVKNGGTAGELEYSSMVETSTGVGIGTASPNTLLHLETSGTGNSEFTIKNNNASPGSGRILFADQGASDAGVIQYEHDANAMVFKTNTSEAARIDSSGNVGINHSSPQFGLTIGQSANDIGKIGWEDGSENKRASITCSSSSDALQFHTGTSDTERMRITSQGHIFFGRTNQTINNSNHGMVFFDSDRLDLGRDVNGTASVFQAFGNVGQFRIMGDGDAENTNNRYTGISDIKYKQNVQDASSQWDDIKAIQVRKYELIANPGVKNIGVVAQELEQICPGLVIERTVDEETGETAKSVAYSVLYMKAVKALQEAQTRIETLETQNTAQQAQIDDLLARVTALEAAE